MDDPDAGAAAVPLDFGLEADLNTATELWTAIEGYQSWGSFEGEGVVRPGASPHGAMVRVLANEACMDDSSGPAHGCIIVKENYGEDGETLGAVTVMERIAGYDADANDWFWVKYQPDGTVDSNPMGKSLAGRIGTCIGCHTASDPTDLVIAN